MGDTTTGSVVAGVPEGGNGGEDGIEDGVDERFERAVLAALEAAPLPLGRLVAELDEQGELDFLREDGVDEDKLAWAVSDELMMLDGVWEAPGDIVAALPQLTDGMVLTHRLGAEELEQGAVAAVPDLVGLDHGAPGDLDLASGGKLTYRLGLRVPGEDLSTFAGPAGWLEAFAPGDVLAFRRSGRSVTVEPATTVTPGDVEVELLRGAIDDRIPAGGSEEATPLLFDALTRDPVAFRQPVRPLGELLGAAGLERRGFSFGRAGEEWKSAGEQHRAREDDHLARKWHFSACCAAAYRSVREAFDAFTADPDGRLHDGQAIAEALAHGTVGPAFAERVLGTQAGGDDYLAAFAGRLLDTAPDRRTAPVHLLVAMDAERRGDAATAEAALRAAVRIDPGYDLAAMELVVYELDRGDVRGVLQRLRRSDVDPESDLLRYLEAFQNGVDAPYRGVGRNERCPCGSDRKFKACCQQAPPAVPLWRRVGLLSRKLTQYVHRDHRRARLVGVATSACDPEADDFLERLLALADERIIADIVAFEGGIARDYLDERGPLLPDDERELLERLVDEPRRLWDVVGRRPDGRLLLRSADDGDPCEVPASSAVKRIEPGDLLLARHHGVANDDNPFFGVQLIVPTSLRDDTLRLLASDPDADALAAFVGQLL